MLLFFTCIKLVAWVSACVHAIIPHIKWRRLPDLITIFTSSSRSTEFKDILLWNFSHLLTKTIPISMRIVTSYAMKTETTTWLEFSNREKAIVGQILLSEERNKYKRAGLWELQSEIQVGKLTIWVRSFEIEKLYHSSPGLSVQPE